MKACATAQAAVGVVLVVGFAFAGCGGKTPEPTAPTAAAPTEAAPETTGAGTEEGATGGDGEGGDSEGTEGAGGDSEGGDKETRTTEVIQKLVQDNRKPIRACYDKAVKDLPDLAGTMTIHFVLDPEGKVKTAELNVERSEIKAPELVKCAIAELKKIKFPPSSRGMESTINYPFSFNKH
jgi:outer membrane biosynthesis protein TonB